ncbi:MAG: hypothetical protein DMF89_16410 [Acidobacteria bacterium]|nr:MAG: hypothetical protein DMF89_16410 [Acidobacteriota bacterium]
MSVQKILVRRREAAEILGFSQSQILKFERQGLLTPIRVESPEGRLLRSTRYEFTEVQALAQKWKVNSLSANATHKQLV